MVSGDICGFPHRGAPDEERVGLEGLLGTPRRAPRPAAVERDTGQTHVSQLPGARVLSL